MGSEMCIRDRLNKGLSIELFDSDVEHSINEQIAHDPDLGVLELKRIDVLLKNPLKKFYMKYHGVIEPTIYPAWGCHGDLYIIRAETLWYPFTVSCRTVFWGLLYGYHDKALILFKIGKLTPVASLDVVSEDNGEIVFGGENIYQPIEFIIGPFKREVYAGDKQLFVYTLNKPSYTSAELYKHLDNVERAYEELYSVKSPHNQYHLVFLKETGGFHAGSMIVLDEKYIKTSKGLTLNLVHEFSHIWWAGKIKLCSPDSTWLMEAIPEYITTRIGGILGILEYTKQVKEVVNKAKSILRSGRYRPPTTIPMPMNEYSESIWRVVGPSIFYEVGNVIGYESLDHILSVFMEESLSSNKPYCLTWKTLRRMLYNLDERVSQILNRYGV